MAKPANIEPAAVKSAIRKIENFADEKASAHGSYLNRCGQIQEKIDGALDEASRKGVPAKSLRAAIKTRAKRRTAEAVLAKLEAEERDIVREILKANDDPADLPLWKAASVRHEAAKHAAAAEQEEAAVY
jgi:hypothetical protein